jgi:hypothetical protein
MRFAVYIPNFGPFFAPSVVAETAGAAEAAGWDGLFMWDHLIWGEELVGDPWIALAAAAVATHHLRLGPVAVPIPRRRPWQVARAATTLDLLSEGRAVLGVGIGSDAHGDFSKFDEQRDAATRGRMLDEGLGIIRALWSGRPVHHTGEFFRIDNVAMRPNPIQEPSVPIWVAGDWPRREPFERARRWDGAVPQRVGQELTVDDVRELRALVGSTNLDGRSFDVLHIGHTPDNKAESRRRVRALSEAGATWWLENLGIGWLGKRSTIDYESIRERIALGPPK